MRLHHMANLGQDQNVLFRSDFLSSYLTQQEAPITHDAVTQEFMENSAFNQDQISINSLIDFIAHIALPIEIPQPFFSLAVEWKLTARAGVAMVWARRQLQYLAAGNYGQAAESLCFSLTADSNIGVIWVQWFSSDSYYMKRVKGFFFGCSDSVGELTALIAKIVDWGLNTRVKDVKKDLNTLIGEERNGLLGREKETEEGEG
ncbi:hypothetical protein FGG08_001158 [Glutinoglossum americanum]|uniref:Uncharacterized protein n=1 Tax=Glutinoglossum americanum TaxID=1670608 RepID=A0A9P8IBY0_9PEZI|nr:hypothetical protein FGG08_001158 [Glutinoglossum americanum]